MKKFRILSMVCLVSLFTFSLSSCMGTGDDDLDRCIYQGDCGDDENASARSVDQKTMEVKADETPSEKDTSKN